MKKLRLHFILFFTILFASNLSAQIPAGTTAPDWTATDLDGNTHSMYDILNSGKHVILEFSAIWCGPCWNFHQTGTLETLHELYGPDGTDQIRVFYIEADLGTNTSCLYGPAGCNGNTLGDWVSDHEFSFIDLSSSNAPNMAGDYQVGYYPTIYAVNANGANGVFEVGQETSIPAWESWFFESFEMEMASSVVQATCPGEGAIDLDVSNGAGSISYSWNNGAGNASSLEGLSAGTYSVTATDDNGYEIVESFTLTGPSEPLTVELLASNDVECFGENTGVLNIGGQGGNGGYSFAWSNGATGNYIDGLIGGEYTVEITDVEGCTSLETYFIEEPDLLTLTSLPENANCGAGDGAVISFAIGGVGPFSYDYGEGPNTNGSFDNVAPGDYVMTVTDGNGCMETSSFSISSTEGPTAIIESSDVLDCNTTEIVVSGAGSSEGDDISYAWSSDDGNIVEGADELEATVSAEGTYTLAVTDASTGCITETSITVEANLDTPVAEIASPETLDCNTTMTDLDASESSEGDNISYSWTTENGSIVSGATTVNPSIDAGGTYTLLITNSETGCTTEQSVDVMMDDEAPALSVENVVLDCSVIESQLCADVDASTDVTWMTPEGEVEATCITVSMAGTYTALAKGQNGCESTAEAIVSLSADLPQVTIEQPEAITCTVTSVSIEATLDGDLADYAVEWTNENGEIINASDLSVMVSDAGMYTLEVTNSLNGCVTTNSVVVDEIFVNPVSGFTSILEEGSLTFENTATGDPSSFSWSFGSEEPNAGIVFSETGIYEVCLTVTNDCGEDTYCEDVYFVSQLLFETSTVDVLCFGEATGLLEVVPSGGEPGYTISWVGPNGFTSSEFTITDLEAGEYTMILNDSYEYEKSESFVLLSPDAVVQDFIEITNETNSDANGTIEIDVFGGTGDLSYEWSNGETTLNIDGLSAGEYTLWVTDANGCTTQFGPFDVQSSTGVADLDIVSNMEIYPVPAINYVNLSITLQEEMNTQLRIIDAMGKVIQVETYATKEITRRINLDDFAAGVYYIEFGNGQQRTLEKFVVLK